MQKQAAVYRPVFAKRLISRAALQHMCMMYCLLIYIAGHEFGNRLRQRRYCHCSQRQSEWHAGFEVTGYLLQQLVKSGGEARKIIERSSGL